MNKNTIRGTIGLTVVDELQASYVDGYSEVVAKLCRKASAILAERNRLCKLKKN